MSSPENPKLWMWGCGMDAPEFSANHTHEMECLVSADLLAVVRRGVESGTIKGVEAWSCVGELGRVLNSRPEGYHIGLEATHTDECGPALIIPVSDGGSET